MPESKFSRPATLEDLKKVVRSLNENNAKYILIGGYAIYSHGYHRTTEDIDLLVPDNAASSVSGTTVWTQRESLKKFEHVSFCNRIAD